MFAWFLQRMTATSDISSSNVLLDSTLSQKCTLSKSAICWPTVHQQSSIGTSLDSWVRIHHILRSNALFRPIQIWLWSQKNLHSEVKPCPTSSTESPTWYAEEQTKERILELCWFLKDFCPIFLPTSIWSPSWVPFSKSARTIKKEKNFIKG